MRELIRAMFELEDFTLGVDDILRLQPNSLLLRTNTAGTARTGGGTYERPLLQLWSFGADGLLTRFEYFETERAADAMARFDELTSTTPPTAHFANAATRAREQLLQCWLARDWEGAAALVPTEFRFQRLQFSKL